MAKANREQALARAAEYGVDEAVAQAVVEAYERLTERSGRSFDPSTWSRTVWIAEADRWQRSPSPDKHFTLLLHLEELREAWEDKARRGARGWRPGQVGERLTKR